MEFPISFNVPPPPPFSNYPSHMIDYHRMPPPIIQPILPQQSATTTESTLTKSKLLDKTTIYIKNFPNKFKKSDIIKFLNGFGAISVKCKNSSGTGTKTKTKTYSAMVKFSTESEAIEILQFLHQKELFNSILSVEFGKIKQTRDNYEDDDNDDDEEDKSNENNSNTNKNSIEFIKKIYGINSNLDFDQPPPMHLKYLYPKCNRAIIDSITSALETNTKFYTQVIHLMNRMNLEPPFIFGTPTLDYPRQKNNIAIQTTDDNDDLLRPSSICCLLTEQLQLTKNDLLSNITDDSDESELETSDDGDDHQWNNENAQIKNQNTIKSKKRKRKLQLIKMKNLKRFRAMIDSSKMLKNSHLFDFVATDKKIKTSSNGLPSSLNDDNAVQSSKIFERDSMVQNKSIKIIVPSQLPPPPPSEEELELNSNETEVINHHQHIEEELNDKQNDTAELHILTDQELSDNRLPMEQLKLNPLFSNYIERERSNKLYVKNLAKTVNENDLKSIYYRYLRGRGRDPTHRLETLDQNDDGEPNEIDIRLMQSGRMKGQAFITFNQPYLDDENYAIVERALAETNGYILKDKIMIVCYGKGQK